MKRILLIRFSAMGDVILITPLIRMIKTSLPDVTVDVLVKESYAPLLEYNPHVNTIYRFPERKDAAVKWRLLRSIRNANYDGIVNLQGNFRSCIFTRFGGARTRTAASMFRIKRWLLVRWKIDCYGESPPVSLRFLKAVEKWGIQDDGAGAEILTGKKAAQSVEDTLRENGIGQGDQVAVLAPGAGRMTKRWPADRYAALGSGLQEKGYTIILTGGPADSPVCSEVAGKMSGPPLNTAGKLSLLETAALLRAAHLLVTNDTGVMHMAAAVSTPLIALFGPTTRQLGFFPFRARSLVIERTMECRPCSYHGTARCPLGHFRCMKDIHPEEVIASVEPLLES